MCPSISKCIAKRCNCCKHLFTKSTFTSSMNGREFSGVNNLDQSKKNISRADFLNSSEKNSIRYKRLGYKINVLGQSACLVVNPITANDFGGWSCIRHNDGSDI